MTLHALYKQYEVGDDMVFAQLQELPDFLTIGHTLDEARANLRMMFWLKLLAQRLITQTAFLYKAPIVESVVVRSIPLTVLYSPGADFAEARFAEINCPSVAASTQEEARVLLCHELEQRFDHPPAEIRQAIQPFDLTDRSGVIREPFDPAAAICNAVYGYADAIALALAGLAVRVEQGAV